MKKGLSVLLIIGALVLMAGCKACNLQRSLVASDENVKKEWAGVQSAYQRRADLIPNLVSTVKGAADFEKSTYVQVAQARAGQLKDATNAAGNNMTAENFAKIQEASRQAMEAARMVINVAVERYPDLKANQNFLSLQDELAGTENRINVSRNKFNEAVQVYNVEVRTFPNNILAGMLGFVKKDMFEADKSAQSAPKVQF